eukprot:CAMPEP_0196580154 /NCGR_PEP_ID=MMETSP1081-20130531/27468_1 /TAXON_ID=36882 /ORGANISM="Pyramimonas amylifera, Strain CCMP720" /LENGTH=164 /DNA_ID=CAMNT_0041899953 /DNA_START=137 /DNA_END=631 /DNA_ORIENTATION=+
MARVEKAERRDVANNQVELPRVLKRLSHQTLLVRRTPAPEDPEAFLRPVTSLDIVSHVASQMNIEIKIDSFDLPQPLTHMGLHQLPLIIDQKRMKVQPKLKVHIFSSLTKKADIPSSTLVVDRKADDFESNEENSEDEEVDIEQIHEAPVERAPRALPSANNSF